MPPDDVLVVYVTCADLAEARRIGRAVVEDRLAACANLRPHESIYRWQGAVETAEEVGLLLKTTRAAWPALRDRVRALHGYQVPCIVAWPLLDGLPEYLGWVADSVG
jgi:periplasmic divalent cation tolerance protein